MAGLTSWDQQSLASLDLLAPIAIAGAS